MTNVPLTAMSSTETNGSYQVVIGADDLAPPSRPENNYWFVVVDLSNLSVVANELSASNDSVPAPVLKFAGNPDYMLVMMTVAVYAGSIPQGSLTEFLQEAGAGTQLRRLEQAISQLGTGVLGPVSYILASTLDTSDGFEEMSLDGQSVLTLELVPVDVGGQTRYTPVSLSD